ncbi:MAG TPA: diguanylate cyclase [Burkholderiaceae bacterium]|nr:diguanylate cyclase [Burkholderiaceae bacterium]
MGTRARLNLYLALTFFVVFCISSALLYRSLVDGAMTQVMRESSLQMEMALAVRKYTIDEVGPLLPAYGETFHPPSVPGYAANRTMALLQETHPQYRYQEVALNPTNPANRAAPWQVDVIEAFRTDPERKEWSRIQETADGPLLQLARPVRASQACLRCHGEPTVAPAGLLKRYGPEHGFHWKEGEVIGAQIVSVPTGTALAQAHLAWWRHVGASLVAFAALFLVLNYLLARTVIAPIETSNSAWRELATTDALTGALNRRSFEAKTSAFIDASGGETTLAIVLVDIDHFKEINDRFGHDIGDAVLKAFAQRMLQASKRRDCLFRLGGEEFALLLPHTNLPAACAFAEVLRRSLAAAPFAGAGFLTASFGVATLMPGDTLETLTKRADRALYQAKGEGRNRVVCETV